MRRIKRAGKATDLPPSKCPGCEHTLYGTISVNEDFTPSPGDVSVCGKCGSFLRITDEMGYRLLTYEEIVDMDAGNRAMLVEMREMVHEMNKIKAEREK